MHMSRSKTGSAVIENDHIEYWSFVNFKVLSSNYVDHWMRDHNPLFSFIDSQIMNVLKPRPRYYDDANRRFQNAIIQSLYYHPFFSAVWAGFAYLEGLCRRTCGDYVDVDGTVKRAFRVCGQQYRTARGNRRAKKGKKGRVRISNLHHLLELTRRQVSKGTRKILFRFFRDYTPFDISCWRNDSLHGSEGRSTTIIVLYCLISVLLLDFVCESEGIVA